ncbi:MAG: metallophosphoesterase family protein [Anaerolineae bacterium]|nr:metallophosphoesterase family protein [Anaerolineae bacterium]
MRFALVADIHGNPVALDAVLRDIEAQGGIESIWFNGDYAAIGPDPVGVLERLIDLPNTVFTRGNTDRHSTREDLIESVVGTLQTEPHLAPKMVEIVQSFSWTRGMISAHGWYDWLAGLPLEQRWTLPDGTRLLMVHAAPGRDDGPGFSPVTPEHEMAAMLDGCEADLVIVGHIHWPLDRTVGGVRLINTGSVSNSPARDTRASYAILDADSDGVRVEFRRVDYDRAAVIDAIRRVHHPTPGYLLEFMEGRFVPPWAEQLTE